jgi:hypothetical protein
MRLYSLLGLRGDGAKQEGLADAECGGFTCWTVEGRAHQEEGEDTIVGLRKKYP